MWPIWTNIMIKLNFRSPCFPAWHPVMEMKEIGFARCLIERGRLSQRHDSPIWGSPSKVKAQPSVRFHPFPWFSINPECFLWSDLMYFWLPQPIGISIWGTVLQKWEHQEWKNTYALIIKLEYMIDWFIDLHVPWLTGISDWHRNPNKDNKDHLVGQCTMR